MWTTVAMAVSLGLTPAGAGELTLSNVRFTHGVLGPVRSAAKVLPGDNLFLCFDIEGVTLNDEGKVRYGIGLDVADPRGKDIFKRDPGKQEVTATLGGKSVPAFVNLSVGTQQPPGEYTLTVTVHDLVGGGKQTLTKKVEVLPKDFGLVQLSTTADHEGLLPVPSPGVGQALWLHVGAVGFERDATTKQPNVTIAMRILDEADKPTLPRPPTGTINKNVPEDHVLLPVRYPVLLNRAGKFTVELTATDQVSGKKSVLTFPLAVVETR
jgi:hypothetical protein